MTIALSVAAIERARDSLNSGYQAPQRCLVATDSKQARAWRRTFPHATIYLNGKVFHRGMARR